MEEWNSKRRRALHLYSSDKHWFCYVNGEKKYPQVYLEEFRYEITKKTMVRFIDVELDLYGSDDSNNPNCFNYEQLHMILISFTFFMQEIFIC